MIIRLIQQWIDRLRKKAEERERRQEVAAQLRVFAAEGRDIAERIIAEGNLPVAAEVLGKCEFLDKLAHQTERGEVPLKPEWPDVIE